MAVPLHLDDLNLRPTQPDQSAHGSPTNASTASSSPSSTFSLDAPSSQSSVTSSIGWSSSTWHLDNNIHLTDGGHSYQRHTSVSSEGEILQAESILSQSRQHPRRTQQRLDVQTNNDGTHTSLCPRHPPALIRQSERKDNFVDSLVDTATQMIETIWPLSVLSCGRDTILGAKQQNLLGLRTFVQEVLKRSKTSYSTLQVALYYLILIQSCMPKFDFTMEQVQDSASVRALQCGRRMFLAALILASKYLQDRNFSARAWSKISGLRTCEINTNEMAFLSAVNWKLHMPEATFQKWTDIVLKYSPSSQVNTPPRSSPTCPYTWRSLIPLLTPDLDAVDGFGSAEIAYDSGYDSASSDESSNVSLSLSHQESPVNQDSDDPVSYGTSHEPKPCHVDGKHQIKPPSLHLGNLPTPQFTPQTGAWATPAVSVPGDPLRRPSMGYAMAEIRKQELCSSTLDNPRDWRPRLQQLCPLSARRSSLATSASSVSSPDSTMSQVSFSRPSRSSSISSVASSSSAALPQPRLAVQATRRCATMQSTYLKEDSERVKSMGQACVALQCKQSVGHDLAHRLGAGIASVGTPELCGESKSSNRSTHEAATALRDLALSQRAIPSSFANHGQISLRSRPHASTSLKRARPTSIDLSSTSVQADVRDLLASNNEGYPTVLIDEARADSFLLRGTEGPRSVSRAFDLHKQPKPSMSRDGLPRKKTCAGSDRGGKAEARMYEKRVAGSSRESDLWGHSL